MPRLNKLDTICNIQLPDEELEIAHSLHPFTLHKTVEVKWADGQIKIWADYLSFMYMALEGLRLSLFVLWVWLDGLITF